MNRFIGTIAYLWIVAVSFVLVSGCTVFFASDRSTELCSAYSSAISISAGSSEIKYVVEPQTTLLIERNINNEEVRIYSAEGKLIGYYPAGSLCRCWCVGQTIVFSPKGAYLMCNAPAQEEVEELLSKSPTVMISEQ